MKLNGYELEEYKTSFLHKTRTNSKIMVVMSIIFGIVCLIGAIVMFALGLKNRDETLSLGALLPTAMVLIWIGMGFYHKKLLYAIDAELVERPNREKESFYVSFYQECVKNNIKKLDSEANKQRAILLGNQLEIVKVTENNVDDYFNRGKVSVKEEESRERMEKLHAQRNKLQQEEAEKANQFQALFGRDKRIKMINDKLIPLQEAKKAMKTVAVAMMSSAHQEKELDWASMGGAASAIGGTAAGISVAVQAQRENENIRARNAANQAAVNRQALSVHESSLSLSDKIEKLEKKLEKARLALVDDKLTKQELFDQLCITYETTVDNSGVLSITAKVKLKQKLVIFGDVTAAIDGMLSAVIFLNDKSIGNILLVAPLEGIHSESKETLLAGKMVVPYDDRKGNFTINIFPYSLWAIEKA